MLSYSFPTAGWRCPLSGSPGGNHGLAFAAAAWSPATRRDETRLHVCLATSTRGPSNRVFSGGALFSGERGSGPWVQE